MKKKVASFILISIIYIIISYIINYLFNDNYTQIQRIKMSVFNGITLAFFEILIRPLLFKKKD